MSIGGLPGLSGYDFSAIVDNLVEVYSMPKNQMLRRRTSLETTKALWKDINTRLAALDQKLTALKDQNLWTSSSATSSNTNLLSATAGSGATRGIYNVVVNQTAQAQTVVSAVQGVTSATAATTLKAGSFKITVGETTKSINVSANDSLSAIATKINNANAGVNASVVQVSGGYQLAITDSKTGIANVANFADESWSFSFNVNGSSQSITINATDTLSDIAANINSNVSGVTASIIQVNGEDVLSITDNTLGTTTEYTTGDLNSGKILANLGVLDSNGVLKDATSDPSLVAQGGITLAARDSMLTINGIPNISSSSNTITTAIPGVTLNLKGSDPATQLTVNVEADNGVAQKAVQEFIDQYNSVMNFISSKLGYDPDTKKAGELQGDSRLQGIQQRLRGILGGVFSNPTSPYKILKDIGISTSKENFGKDATLSFDTAKFAEAMSQNPQSVANLFGAPYGGVTPTNDNTDTTMNANLHQGIANYLHAYIYPMIKYDGSLDKTIGSLDKQISDVNKRLEDFDDRIESYRERMKLKFAALESTLSGLNAQGTWLSGQISAMEAQMKSK